MIFQPLRCQSMEAKFSSSNLHFNLLSYKESMYTGNEYKIERVANMLDMMVKLYMDTIIGSFKIF